MPVLAKDLSGISKQVNAPIKILLGVNLLRHLRPTIDFAGGSSSCASFDPPPPPAATTLRLAYARGGGMLVRGAFGAGDAPPAARCWWTRRSPSRWRSTPRPGRRRASLRQAHGACRTALGEARRLPSLRLGAFDVPQIPGLQSDSAVKEREEGLGIELDGLLGSGLLATFRVTLIDGGRAMWLEDLPPEALVPPPAIMVPDIDMPLDESKSSRKREPTKPGAKPKGAPPDPKAPAAPAKPNRE